MASQQELSVLNNGILGDYGCNSWSGVSFIYLFFGGSVLNISCMKTLVTLSECLRLPDLESFFEGHYRHSTGVICSWK